MTKILFVEDHVGLLDDLVELLLRMRGAESLVLRFATSVDESVERLSTEEFDVVVADVMLPSHPGVPAHDEGIYLVAWILGHVEKLPASLKRRKRSRWLKASECRPVLLSSRTAEMIRATYRALAGDDAADKILIIERLRVSANEQAKKILAIADGKAAEKG